MGKGLLLLLIFMPMFLCFNYVFRFGVNVPVSDDWDFVPLLRKSYEGTVGVADFLIPHNEHILLVPRLVMLPLAHITRYNTVAEMYSSWFLVCLIVIALLFQHVKAFGTELTSLASFVPISWLVCSLRQSENLLWGWQLQIFLCVFSVVAASLLLTKVAACRSYALLASLLAAAASLSFAAGVAVWPAGLVYLLSACMRQPQLRKRFVAAAVTWCGLALLIAVAYYRVTVAVHGDASPSSVAGFSQFALVVLGGALASDVSSATAIGTLLLVILGVLLSAAVLKGIRREYPSSTIVLLLFSMLVAPLLARGRLQYGLELATSSRYTTLSTLWLISLYWLALSLRQAMLRRIATGSMLVLIAFGLVNAFRGAYEIGIDTRNVRHLAIETLRNYRSAPDADISWQLFYSPPLFRERAAVLASHRLSVFARQTQQ